MVQKQVREDRIALANVARKPFSQALKKPENNNACKTIYALQLATRIYHNSPRRLEANKNIKIKKEAYFRVVPGNGFYGE